MSVSIKVRGYHLDVYNHVNNGRYLEFLEESRWDFLEQGNVIESLAALNLAMVVVNININYRLPALLGDTLEITTSINRIGNKSASFEQSIIRHLDNGQSDIIADATVTFCLMDQAAHKAVVIDGNVRSLLDALSDFPGQAGAAIRV